MKCLLPLLLLSLPASAQLPDKPTPQQVRHLKDGTIRDDTSFVYTLPWKEGKSFLFIQGAYSKMSHKGELSYDFKMKQGSAICAARAGEVVRLRADSDKGGLKEENLSDGNFIIIRHDDGSEAHYWHLQKDGVLVGLGDHVVAGQAIGLSGNTGYTAFPHLHFQVYDVMGGEQLVRFSTKKGAAYIRPGKWYRAVSARQ